MDPERIMVIPEWPTPPCIREISGFNDVTNFYKRFVSYFSILVAPLRVGEEPCSLMGRCLGKEFSDLTLLKHTQHY